VCIALAGLKILMKSALEMLTPGIAYLSKLMLCCAFVMIADVTHRCAWVEVLTANRATNGVFISRLSEL